MSLAIAIDTAKTLRIIARMAEGPRLILFEGVSLPEGAHNIDHLGMYENLPEMSEETSEWLWRFPICSGRPRTAPPADILRYASETLDLMNRFRDRLLQTIPQHFGEPFGEDVLDNWQRALEMIAKIADSRDQCTWEIPLQPGDRYYGFTPAEIAEDMLSNFDKAAERITRPEPKR